MSGKLVVLEGLDGSGKSTQADLLCARLERDGTDYRKIKLPDYDSPSSSLVKMYLGGQFGKSAEDVNAYAASSFYAVDRYASYNTDWKADYLRGSLVFADRYTPSNAVYQMTKLPKSEWDGFLDWLYDFEFVKMGLPKPDLVMYLDMPVEISQRLMTYRYNGDNNKKDVHEADVSFLNACREAALYSAEKCGWAVIECSFDNNPLPIKAIGEKIYDYVRKYL